MNAKDQITDSITKTPANSNDDSESRHYLGLWHLNISDSSDLLGCAWRDNGQWNVRFRFRHDLDFPVCYEARYERCGGFRSEGDAQSFMTERAAPQICLIGPSRMHPFASKAIQVVFGRPELLSAAVDEQTLPVVPKADAERLNLIFMRHDVAGVQGNWERQGARSSSSCWHDGLPVTWAAGFYAGVQASSATSLRIQPYFAANSCAAILHVLRVFLFCTHGAVNAAREPKAYES